MTWRVSTEPLIFVCFPTATGEVSILVSEIASMRSHVVISDSHEWTEFTLKSGVKHDCRVSKADALEQCRKAWTAQLAGGES